MTLEIAPEPPSRPEGGPLRRDLWAWLVLVAILLAAAAIRVRLLDIPLERDEGEYAYAGQLWLQGISSFGHVYNMKMPGIYAAYAAIVLLFGETSRGIHVGFLLINTLSIVLMFCLAKRLFDAVTAVLAALAFALLSMSQAILGMAGHAAHLVMLFALAGLLVLLDAMETKRRRQFFWSGLLLGVGFTMKQPGALFAVFAAGYMATLWVAPRRGTLREFAARFALFAVGLAVPVAVIFLAAWGSGHFTKFWFWTFEYLEQYGAQTSPREGLANLLYRLSLVVPPAVSIWLLALVGSTSVIWDKAVRGSAAFALGFALFSVAAVCPGLYFRANYFIFLMPALALLAALGAMSLGRLIPKKWASLRSAMAVALLGAAVVSAITAQRRYLLEWSPVVACRETYGANPFPESPEIAQYIRSHTGPADTVAVIGSEPQIYFYAHRHAATGYVYTYALMERHPFARKMQDEMIAEIEASRPKFLVFVGVSGSWLATPASDRTILDWVGRYMREQYYMAGLTEITPDRGTVWLWGREAAEHPLKYSHCLILERKDAPAS